MTLYRKYWWHINRWNATHWQEQISYLSYAGLITGTRNFNFFCWQGRKTLCFWCRVAFIMERYWVVHPTKSLLANVRIIYELTNGENVTCPTIGKKLSQGLSFSKLQDSWERGSRKEKLRENRVETGKRRVFSLARFFLARPLFRSS